MRVAWADKGRYAAKRSGDHRRDMQTVVRGVAHATWEVDSRDSELSEFDSQVQRRPE